ncbi:MAG: hypothetical protein Q9168_004918 [Polycauliona sp. 1 TL-2023]
MPGGNFDWDLIANEMSTTINSELSESAIVQHLANFRARVVQQGHRARTSGTHAKAFHQRLQGNPTATSTPPYRPPSSLYLFYPSHVLLLALLLSFDAQLQHLCGDCKFKKSERVERGSNLRTTEERCARTADRPSV